MKISELSPENKAKVLSTVGLSVQGFLGNENLFFMLLLDDTGHMAHNTNINREAIPRLLREYAHQMEQKASRNGA